MISAGVEGRLPYMTYPEPWRGPPKQPPELFLRPAPKSLPPTSRYNGINTTTYPNGTRLAPPARPISKYPSPPSIPNPVVSIAQPKEEINEEMYSPYRFPHHIQFPSFPYPLCQPSYIMRPNFPPTPLSPMDTFSPTTPTPTSTFLSPPATFSPPSALKPERTIIREKRTPPRQTQPSPRPPPPPSSMPPQSIPPPLPPQSREFKVPSGKEGSLKHRILTRPEDLRPLDLQKPPQPPAPVTEGRKRLTATISPPRSPKKTLNNNTIPGNFTKGSLIQLHNGELRRIEDMRTEDFVMSAERSPELRLAESTVVRIEDNQQTGNATITLTYNQRRAKVEVESSVEHPYFVMGHGWASCNPERTQQCYGLKVHKLHVGDILISLTPREPAPPPPPPPTMVPPSSNRSGTTIMTTATTTAMTARQISASSCNKLILSEPTISSQTHPINLHLASSSSSSSQPVSPDSLASRKRRWSAPDQICDEEDQAAAATAALAMRRSRVE